MYRDQAGEELSGVACLCLNHTETSGSAWREEQRRGARVRGSGREPGGREGAFEVRFVGPNSQKPIAPLLGGALAWSKGGLGAPGLAPGPARPAAAAGIGFSRAKISRWFDHRAKVPAWFECRMASVKQVKVEKVLCNSFCCCFAPREAGRDGTGLWDGAAAALAVGLFGRRRLRERVQDEARLQAELRELPRPGKITLHLRPAKLWPKGHPVMNFKFI